MKPALTASELWRLRRVGFPVPLPDGSAAVVGVKTYDVSENKGRERLFLVRPGAEPRPLTSPEVSSGAPTVSPDGKQLAFVRTPPSGGGGHGQLHVMPLDGGEARCVTDLPLGIEDPHWLPDGKHVAFLAALYQDALTVEGTRKRAEERAKDPVRVHVTEDRIYRFWDRWLTDGQVHHIFIADTTSGTVTDLTPDSRRWFDLMDAGGQFDVSPDGQEICFSANCTQPPYHRVRWALYTVPTAGGEVRCVTPDNPSDDIRPRYSPDGKVILFGTKRDPENYSDRVRLASIPRGGGPTQVLTESWDFSCNGWESLPDGTVIIEADDRARGALFRLPPGGTPTLLQRGGCAHGIRPAGGHVWFQHQSLRSPPEIARVDASGTLQTVSSFNRDVLDGVALGEVEEIHYEGAGGDNIQGFLVYPPGYDKSKRYPIVHAIHGGPYGANADMWHFRWNPHVFASPGYVVALVNFHGSAGFGQAFSDSILGDWGGKAAQDIERATDHLIARGIADPKRMAITGGSFGGYMTAWLTTQTDRYACAISHAPVYDMHVLMASDVTQGVDRDVGAAPWELPRDREALARWNPAAHTAAYRTPLLVVHGEKDYRCSVEHGLELYGTLKARGVPARLVVYPEEGHWITKPKSSLHWYGEFLGWLSRYLREGNS
jgi:dipeptidyl aminopeptidase/acylaminoacyl peptidase